MVKGRRKEWYAGLVIVLAVAVVFALSEAVTAGSGKEKKGEKGYLGVFMQELDEDVREGLDLKVQSGVLISGVEEDGPADEAGLKEGDVIVVFDGQEVEDPDDLRKLVRETDPGDEVEVEVIRDGERKTLTLKVGEWPEDFGWLSMGDLHFDRDDLGRHFDKMVYAISSKPRLGVEVSKLNEDLASYFETEADSGLLVLEVDDESVADAAGLKAGDVILEVDGEAVSTVAELRESLEDFEEGDEFEVVVVRKGKKTSLTATMDEPESVFHWSGDPHKWMYRYQLPKVHQFRIPSPGDEFEFQDELREEIDELRAELEKMKKELEEIKK